MLFNSIDFLVYFPVVVSIFYLIPRRVRCIWLLVASYYFYMCWNPKYIILIALSTFITYISGILIERCNVSDKYNAIKWKKLVVAGSLFSNLAILFVFKYANFILGNIDSILQHVAGRGIDRRLDILLPVGISFYTFQALSYTIDVYRGTINAEKSIFKYALFVSFFPQLVAGPIERSKNLLTQIRQMENNSWKLQRVRDGLLLMTWGFFQKLVIADRASILVRTVYNNYEAYGFAEIITATILFAFQIYCDFGGYTNIARGCAQVMGFHLMQNFRQPYLAVNIKEFWRRWHISLTSWFTDYLYIPLGGNRKGKLHKYFNTLVVFLTSGLWHGASWSYVAWGVHAVFQIVGDAKCQSENRVKVKNSKCMKSCRRVLKIICTFIMVDFAWIFFAAADFTDALGILSQMFKAKYTVGIFELGLDAGNWGILIAAIVILIIVDILHEKKVSIFRIINQQRLWIRWGMYLMLIWSVIMFGIYGIDYDVSQFIYFQF